MTKQRYQWGLAAVTQPLRVFKINPDEIRYNGPRFERSKYIGTVRSGDWDRNPSEWGGYMYESFQKRFLKGYDWEETQYYQKAKRRLKQNNYHLGYTDLETFENERLPYLDRLFEDIRENGYQTQKRTGG